MGNDEVDFDQAKPVKTAQEVSEEKVVGFFKGEESNPLQPKELTEDLLERLYENMQEAEHLAKLIEMSKRDVNELCKGHETVQKGKYVVILKAVKGRRSMDWKKFTRDKIGEITEADIEKYSHEGEPSVRLEIKKIG